MIESIRTAIEGLPPAALLLAGMVILASLDFLAAVFGHLRDGDFHLSLIGKWAGDKGLPIVAVALLFVVDQAVTILQLPIEGFDVGIFGLMATAQAGTFILGEIASIQKNLATKPIEEPVPEE